MAIIQFEEEVLEVLNEKANPHQKHLKLKAYMTAPQWGRVRLELAVPVILWVTVIGPFNTAVSKPISYGEIKLAFMTALETVNRLMSADNAFTVGLSMALDTYSVGDGALEDHTKQALDRIANERWCVAPIGVKRQVAATTVKALNECKLKLERDWEIMGTLGLGDNHVMEWSQRRIEASFAFLKCCARRFETMRSENVQVLARARQNHVSSWVAYDLDKMSDRSVKKAYYERMEMYEHDFTLEEAVESFTDAL